MPANPPPPGFVHIDLDGLWTVAEAYGHPADALFHNDPVFEFVLPRLLDFLETRTIKATFFVVGRDLEIDSRRAAILEIHKRGHELANHSYHHWIGLEQRPFAEVQSEIFQTQSALGFLTGEPPVGFRAPGFDAGPKVLTACDESGIRYDGSLLPTRLAPLLRLAARLAVRGGGGSVTRQYGSGLQGCVDGKPTWFHPPNGPNPVLRLPLPVSPLLTWPLHASLGIMLGAARVTQALERCAAHDAPLTYLLHPLDLADPGEILPDLPAAIAGARVWRRPLAEKVGFLDTVLKRFQEITRIQRTRDWLAIEPPAAPPLH